MAAAADSSRVEQRTRAGRLRRFGPTVAQIVGATVACLLWTGVASPGLKLLPGLDGLADESISISLQSAVLGIDDGSNRPAEERARDAAAVLGLTYAESLLSPTAVRAGDAARARGTATPALVTLGDVLAGQLAASAAHAAPRVSRRSDAGPRSPPRPRLHRRGAEPPRDPRSAGAEELRRRPPLPPSAPTFPAAPPLAPPTGLLSAQTVEFTSAAPASAVVGGTYAVSASASSGLPVKYSIAGRKDVCRVSGSTVSFRHRWHLRRRGRPAGQREVQGGAGAAGIPRRPRRTVDHLHLVAARTRRRGRSGLHRLGRRRLRAPGQLRRGRGQRRRLQGLGLVGLADRRRYLHGRGRAAGQRRLRPRAPRAAVLRDRRGADDPGPPVDLLHHVGSGAGDRRRPDLLRRRDRELRSRRQLRRLARAVPASAPSAAPSSRSSARARASSSRTRSETTSIWPRRPRHQSFLVDRAPQAVSFVSTPPASAAAGTAAYTVAAAATSGLPVSVAVAQSSASVCAIAGATVTALDAGTCTIEANQPGDGTFRPRRRCSSRSASAARPRR